MFVIPEHSENMEIFIEYERGKYKGNSYSQPFGVFMLNDNNILECVGISTVSLTDSLLIHHIFVYGTLHDNNKELFFAKKVLDESYVTRYSTSLPLYFNWNQSEMYNGLEVFINQHIDLCSNPYGTDHITLNNIFSNYGYAPYFNHSYLTYNGSCEIYGCTDSLAINYFDKIGEITTENGSCIESSAISADMFTTPTNTGANMTIGVDASKFDQFEGGQIGAFYDVDADGELECVGVESISTGFFGLALWGDDSSTPEVDGLYLGSPVKYSIFHNNNITIVDLDVSEGLYITNGMSILTDAGLSGAEAGCTDEAACNTMFMYSDVTYTDDGSCTYAAAYHDCEGVCLNDADGDDVCDEFEVAGCQNDYACNYNALATNSDGSCDYPQMYYDCAGQCISDVDSDGVCDELEIVGCQNPAFDNYDASATDAGECIGFFEGTRFNASQYNCGQSITTNTKVNSQISELQEDHLIKLTLDVNINKQIADNYHPWGGWECRDYDYYDYDDYYFYRKSYAGIYKGEKLESVFESTSGKIDDIYLQGPNSYSIIFTYSYPSHFLSNNDFDDYDQCHSFSMNVKKYDGSCYLKGCVDSTALNYLPQANIDDGSCDFNNGCTNPNALNYNSSALFEDGSCEFPIGLGSIECGIETLSSGSTTTNKGLENSVYHTFNLEYNAEVMINLDGASSMRDPYILMFDSTQTYLQTITNTQSYHIEDTVELDAGEYSLVVTEGDPNFSSGTLFDYTASMQNNYQYTGSFTLSLYANDGICVLQGCTYDWADNFNKGATTDDGTCYLKGCTAEGADNYNPFATMDDGSCNYTISVDFGILECGETYFYENQYVTKSNFEYEFQLDTRSIVDIDINSLVDEVDFAEPQFYSSYQISLSTYDTLINEWVLLKNYLDRSEDLDSGLYKLSSNESDFIDPYQIDISVRNHCAIKVNDIGSLACGVDTLLYGVTSPTNGFENSIYYSFVLDVDSELIINLDGYSSMYNPHILLFDGTQVFMKSIEYTRRYNIDNYSIDLEAGRYYMVVTEGDPEFYDGDILEYAFSNYNDYNSNTFTLNLLSYDGICDVYGCTYDWADNYDTLSTIDDGSCFKEGCMSDWADNYDTLSTIDDGFCYREGCMSDWADNYDSLATFPDYENLCFRKGCMSDWADNYNPYNTIDDGSCYRLGCTLTWADNYDAFSTTDVGSCYRLGCNNPTAQNYDSLATIDYISSNCIIHGCTYNSFPNFNELANTDDGSCNPYSEDVFGCMDATAFNFDILANIDNGSCIEVVYGCLDSLAFNYDGSAHIDTVQPTSCIAYVVGCMDSMATNFDSLANVHDYYLCEYFVEGCWDAEAFNYDPYVTIDDGSCERMSDFGNLVCGVDTVVSTETTNKGFENSVYYSFSIQDSSQVDFNFMNNGSIYLYLFEWHGDYLNTIYYSSTNYNANDSIRSILLPAGVYTAVLTRGNLSTSLNSGSISTLYEFYTLVKNRHHGSGSGHLSINVFDGTCVFNGCIDSIALNYNPIATIDDGSCDYDGCTDSRAFNFNSKALFDDGSCESPSSLGSLLCGSETNVYGNTSSGRGFHNSAYYSFEVDESSEMTINLNGSSSMYRPYILLFDSTQTYIQTISYTQNYYINDYSVDLDSGEYFMVITNYNPYFSSGTLSNYYALMQTEYQSSGSYGLSLLVNDGVCDLQGCIDSVGINFNPVATTDDGSCEYATDIGDIECNTVTLNDSLTQSSVLKYYQFEVSEYATLAFDLVGGVNIFLFDSTHNYLFKMDLDYNPIDLDVGTYYMIISKESFIDSYSLQVNYETLPIYSRSYNYEINIENTMVNCSLSCNDSTAINHYINAIYVNNDLCHYPERLEEINCDRNTVSGLIENDFGASNSAYYYFDLIDSSLFNFSVYSQTIHGSINQPYVLIFDDDKEFILSVSHSNPYVIDEYSTALDPGGYYLVITNGDPGANFTNLFEYFSNVKSNDQSSGTFTLAYSIVNNSCPESDSVEFGEPYFLPECGVVYNDSISIINGIQTYQIREFTITNDSTLVEFEFEGIDTYMYHQLNRNSLFLFRNNVLVYNFIPYNNNYHSINRDIILNRGEYKIFIGGTYKDYYNSNFQTIESASNSYLEYYEPCHWIYEDWSCGWPGRGCARPTDITCADFNNSGIKMNLKINDTTCDYPGCMDQTAFNFSSWADTDNGACVYEGCTHPDYLEYDLNASIDDGSCLTDVIRGCANPLALNFNVAANLDDGSCITDVWGCTDALACNHNPEANIEDDMCLYPQEYYNCNVQCINDADTDGICDELVVYGCTDSLACNYDPSVTKDDGSCRDIQDNCLCDESCLLCQQIELPSGWSIFSTYMIPSSLNFNDILFDLNQNNQIIIAKDYLGKAYLPEWNFNGIGNAIIGNGYQVKTNGISTLEICGDYAFPESNEILLYSGWNIVGYLRTDPSDIALVFEELTSTNNLVVAKDYFGKAYLPEWNFNGIGDMHPGHGYQLKINEEYTFSYFPNQLCYTESNYDCEGNLDLQIGDRAFGGVVFYIDSTGQHGLIASEFDANLNAMQWGCEWSEIGVFSKEILTGMQNSIDIDEGCADEDIAAKECLSYSYSNYSDWYLPSIDELILMRNTVGQGSDLGNLIQLNNSFYWSSNEYDNQKAIRLNATTGYSLQDAKGNSNRVRPIRSF